MEISKQELIDCLERCVRQSGFVSDRVGRIGWKDYRKLSGQRRWNDTNWMLWSATSKLEIEDCIVNELAGKLKLMLAEFINTDSDKIGNGLFLLSGGQTTWARSTISEFARSLIAAAVRSSTLQVVELLLRWSKGEPLRFRMCALLEGTNIDEDLQLAEGISISRLPLSSADLPVSLPCLGMSATMMDFMGGIVMSIDCEMSPALYRPDDSGIDDIEVFTSQRKEFTIL